MKLPRFTSGGWGKLTYAVINQAFEQIEKTANAARDGGSTDAPPSQFVAKINGLTAGATQGSTQGTDAVSGATFAKSYLYDWSEISIGVGDGASPAGTGTGLSWKDATAAQGTGRASGLTTTYSPAIDIATSQRFAAGDIVVLNRVAVRSGSKYSAMYLITASSASTSFLARLTAKHATIAGIYAWTGLTRTLSGTVAARTAAINLYELNSIRNCDNYAAAISVAGVSWDGSSTSAGTLWGHGQSLTGASATLTKQNLPVGAAGTGTLVQMNVTHTSAVSFGSPAAFGAYYSFYSVAPVSAACDI